MATQTNPFSIAHYILLICIVILCGGIVAYAITHDTGKHPDVLPTPAPEMPNATPAQMADAACIQSVTNAVARMWAYNPDAIPVKYQDVAMAYYTAPVNTTIRGECNGVKFVCRQNMQRMNCDPCAAGSAREYAMQLHTRDMIAQHCKK